MTRLIRCSLLCVALCFLLSKGGAAAKEASVIYDPPSALAERELEEDPAAVSLAQMDLRSRISQMMVATMEGRHGPTSGDLGFLKHYTPAAAMVRQLRQPSSAPHFAAQARGVESLNGIPLWVGANLWELSAGEGGGKRGWFQLPTLMSLAAAADRRHAETMGGIVAEFMGGMGFNFHLGPSLALAPVVAEARGSVHCVGADPAIAGGIGAAFTAKLAERQVLAVPMDFPGGAHNRVSRSGAVLLTPRPLLAAEDLRPYREAIEAGAELIHVGTALTPTIDPDRLPACLSFAVVTGILRGELGFEGVVVAGPVDSEDLRANYDPADAARLAIMAGADLIYWRGGLESVMRGVDRLARDVADGKLSEARVNESVERILRLKFAQRSEAQAGAKPTKADKLDASKRLRRDALPIERHAITLIRNQGPVTPIGKGSMPIGITGVVGVPELRKAMEKHVKPIAMQEIKTARHVGDIQDFEIDRLTRHVAGIRTAVVIVTEHQRPAGVVQLVRGLKSKVPTVIVAHLGYPRPEILLCDADAILLGYSDARNAELTLEAMADVLFGKGPAEALQTETAFRLRTGETGVYKALDVVRSPIGRLPVALGEKFDAGFRLNHDPSGAVARARWEIPELRTGRDWEINHAFPAAGEYEVTLHVRDQQGVESSGKFNVIVQD